jgi:predicted peroxiredoxin
MTLHGGLAPSRSQPEIRLQRAQLPVIASSSPLRTLSQSERSNYAVVLTSGPEDGGKRATLALAAACTAQAMDFNTIVFLVGDGAHWGYDGHAEGVRAPGFPALADLMDSFFESGGQVLLCSACDAVCALPSSAEGRSPARRRDVRVQGLAAVLSHTAKGSSVTF